MEQLTALVGEFDAEQTVFVAAEIKTLLQRHFKNTKFWRIVAKTNKHEGKKSECNICRQGVF